MDDVDSRQWPTDKRSPALGVVIPVFNDWPSLLALLKDLNDVAARMECHFDILIIDDGTIEPCPRERFELERWPHLVVIRILHLVCNMGHQRAIAVGVVECATRQEAYPVVVMDGDGEDRPGDIERLWSASEAFPSHVVVAQRGQRSEGLLFRTLYKIYKWSFALLTGHRIDFGNFSLIPAPLVSRLAYDAALWNNLAATLLRSRVPLVRVDTCRGTRYFGKSHMNIAALVIHGLSAMSVYADVLSVRVFIASGLVAVAVVFGLFLVVCIRYATDWALPGWATGASGLLVVMLLQALMFSAGASFLLLSDRSRPLVIPALESRRYIKAVTSLR